MSKGVPERTCLNLRMLSDGGKQDGVNKRRGGSRICWYIADVKPILRSRMDEGIERYLQRQKYDHRSSQEYSGLRVSIDCSKQKQKKMEQRVNVSVLERAMAVMAAAR